MANPNLYGALASAMVYDLVDRFAYQRASETTPPGDVAISVARAETPLSMLYPPVGFVVTRAMLWRLGVAEALDGRGQVATDDAASFRSYRLAVDGDKAAALVEKRASSGGFEMPPIDEVLGAWLALAVHHELLSSKREPFVPDSSLQEVMKELVRSGYAIKQDSSIQWTEKIAPAVALYAGKDPTLYGALAAGILRYAVDAWEHPPPQRTVRRGAPEPLRAVTGTRFSGHSLSSFERACMLLLRFGVAQPIDREGNPVPDDRDRYLYAGWFRLTIDGNDVADVVTRSVSSGLVEPLSLGDILTVWLECANHFGAISTARDPFDAADDVQGLMHALAHAGYVTWRGTRFLWTDKIGPMMQSAAVRDNSNRCFEDVEKLQIEAELRDAAKSIPEDVRLAVIKGDVQAVREALLTRWYEDAWRAGGGGPSSQYYRRLATVANARRLMAFVVDQDGAG
jgi:hypothetical protein